MKWKFAILLFFVNTPAYAQISPTLSRSSVRECATCHLGWMEAFEQEDATLLIAQPPDSAVSEAATCLGCHDGSVADSRELVWGEHGHQTGIEPPDNMSVPSILPLKDGAIACRTCHTAHGGSGGEDLSNTVFLRVQNDQSQMCRMCHTDEALTPVEHFSHPLGPTDKPIPAALIEAGSHAKPGQESLHCEVCHTPHGSRTDHLLVLGTESNALCLTCHPDQRPAMWQSPKAGKHPDRPVIHEECQLQAIHDMGTALGDENRLICLSCHRMHDARSENYLLAGTLDNAEFCLQCHPEKISVEQTEHDPRQFDQAALHAGAIDLKQENSCSACHLFHKLAVPAAPDGFDSDGLCNSCHRAEGVGHTGDMTASHSLGVPYQAVTEPVGDNPGKPSPHLAPEGWVECSTCHDPHQGKHPAFLKDDPDALCASCHVDTICCMSAVHDFREVLDWPIDVPFESRCLSCHKMHAWEQNPTLFTFPMNEAAQVPADATCMGCHRAIHWESRTSPTVSHGDVLHPQFVQMDDVPADLYTASMEDMTVLSCHTCHDPHGKPSSVYLLYGSDEGVPEQSCYRCHDHTRGLLQTPHGYVSTPEQDHATACQACHNIHAPQDVRPESLFIAPTDLSQPDPSAAWCLGCHQDGSKAERPYVVTHPEPLLFQGALQSWYARSDTMPKALRPDRLTCVVCHLPHGRPQPESPSHRPGVSMEELRAEKMLLRPETARTLCAQCHGSDAARLFLYYHFPGKRD